MHFSYADASYPSKAVSTADHMLRPNYSFIEQSRFLSYTFMNSYFVQL